METLTTTLAEAWSVLTAAALDRHAACYLAQAATASLDGRPSVRTVVLRDIYPARRALRFHTDRRSAKVAELTANPAISLLFHDPEREIQLRLDGNAGLHIADAVAGAAWESSRPVSRSAYFMNVTPDTVVVAPPPAPVYDPHEDAHAFGNFCAVIVDIHQLEWLHLDTRGHRRARFTWSPEGKLTQSWVAP